MIETTERQYVHGQLRGGIQERGEYVQRVVETVRQAHLNAHTRTAPGRDQTHMTQASRVTGAFDI